MCNIENSKQANWKMKMFQEQRKLKNILENIPPIEETGIDVVDEAPWVGSRSHTQILVENCKLSLCAL